MMSLLDDEYLSGYFWQEPSASRARQSRRAAHDAHTWYIEKRWTMVLDEILDRVYLMRCQLVHGAATYGGKLNRTSLKRCVMMMQRLLPALLLVWIDHGADEDWGPMCYPPMGDIAGAGFRWCAMDEESEVTLPLGACAGFPSAASVGSLTPCGCSATAGRGHDTGGRLSRAMAGRPAPATGSTGTRGAL